MLEKDGLGRVVFIGAVHEAQAALRMLLTSPARVVMVVTLAEPLASRTAGYVDLGPMASLHGVSVLRTIDVNDPSVVTALKATQPDLIVCVGWTRPLRERLLALPRHGCVGFHASLLPRNRGRAPVNWAIIRGEQVTGNTMLMLSAGVDNGDIVDQEVLTIDTFDTCATVYGKVGEAGARMLRRHLPGLLQGTAPRRPQPENPEPLLARRTPEMGITGWDAPPNAVYNWIRALTHPYPGAFTYLDGRRVFLWQADDPIDADISAAPGTILGVDGPSVHVATRNGSLRLLLVQADGCGEVTAATWYWRAGLSSGARFDPVDSDTLAWALGNQPMATGTVAVR